jgi:predicted component of type VI protein secretion system
MRIYEGAPRQNYEDVLRSIGALLDQRGMREITLNETEDGFIIQGLALVADEERPWNDPAARLQKETIVLREDDIARFVEEGTARRRPRGAAAAQTKQAFYEPALRALGVYLDQQQPRDIFFFEQEQQFVVRLLMQTRAGLRHMIVEFTREEIGAMIAAGARARGR